jgi:uncharacterized membrane protein YbhN (UPF0104 family)
MVWMFLLLRDSMDQLAVPIYLINPADLVLSVFLLMVTAIVVSYVYFLLLGRVVPGTLPAMDVIAPYLTSQVVRYLPGKIWGVFYQVQAMSKLVHTGDTVKANIEQYALSNMNSIAVAACLYMYYSVGIGTALTVLAVAMTIMFLFIRNSLLHRTISIFSRSPSSINESFVVKKCKRENGLIFSLFQVEWIIYILACAMILPENYYLNEVIIVSVIYAVAALIGGAVFMIPSGIVVREASFIWLSSFFGFDVVDMFTFSIVFRIVDMVAETMCAFFCILFVGIKGSSVKSTGSLKAD